MTLFDEHSSPGLREYLGQTLARSATACFAIRRVRLARVDLLAGELHAVARCRVLLGRLDADSLATPGATRGVESERTAALLDMASSGRLEIRSAPLLTWDPDFAILGHGDPERDVLLFGSIRFAPPLPRRPVDELTLACAIRDVDAIRRAQDRFEELWDRAHDTLEAVTDALCRARSIVDV